MKDKIYIIEQPYGSYDSYGVHIIGYVETEEEAIETCKKLNETKIKSPFKSEEDEHYYDDVMYEWDEKDYDWEMSLNCPYRNEHGFITDSSAYHQWWKDNKCEETREQLFKEFLKTKKVPNGFNDWESFMKQHDEWTSYQIWEYDDFRYKEICKV